MAFEPSSANNGDILLFFSTCFFVGMVKRQKVVSVLSGA
jgi:hypothetical protein